MHTGPDTRRVDGLAEAPDIRTVDLHPELRRCARVLRWVEALPTAELLSPRPPILGDDLVSVVVPMYNASRWIAACLKGLLAQTHRNLEIFCVDDCSQDDTYARVVEQFGRDGRVCVVRLARNVGPFQISNWAAGSLARGRRIAWQDADNVSHPARIEAQCRWMAQQRYRITGTCVHHFFPPGIEPFWPQIPPAEADGMLHELIVYLSGRRTRASDGGGRGSSEDWERAWRRNELDAARMAETGLVVPAFASLGRSACMHGSQMVDTELFREFGGFHGRTSLGEDTEFDWRVSRFHDIGNLPRVLSSRRSHHASLTRDPATGMESSARLEFRARMRARREEIRRELADGNISRARELCTEIMHRAEIQIDRAHCGFDIALS